MESFVRNAHTSGGARVSTYIVVRGAVVLPFPEPANVGCLRRDMC